MDDQNSSDYHNFSQTQSLAHRLPTLNGAEALINAIEKHKPVSTGLSNLDAILSTSQILSSDGGIHRGCITEIYGPPGCGKTHLAIQLAASALSEDGVGEVTWIDTSTQLPLNRLEQFVKASHEVESNVKGALASQDSEEVWPGARFRHFFVDSLARLLALILQPSETLLSTSTTLFVIDDFSDIVASGLPHSDRLISTLSNFNSLSRDDILAKSISTRRAAMLGAMSSGLARLAASRNIAVVVLNKVSTNRKSGESSAVLKSVLNSQQWNDNVSTRIVIYRNFWPAFYGHNSARDEMRRIKMKEHWPLRVAEVEKVNGKNIRTDGTRFVILKDRLHQVDDTQTALVTKVIPTSSPAGPDDDAEEAMGSLEIEDAEEVHDQSIAMPEDAATDLSGPGQAVRSTKRKIDEIANSEDEDEDDLELGTPELQLPVTRNGCDGFLLSSQLVNADLDRKTSTQGSEVTEKDLQAESQHEVEDEAEMLLRH